MTEPKPLTGKITMLMGEPPHYVTMYAEESVRAAVEWLQIETLDMYHKIGKGIIWSLNNDEVADMVEREIHKKICEAFTDIISKKKEGRG